MKPLTLITYFLLFIAAGCSVSDNSFIAVNQVGYNIDEPMQALLVNSDAKEFEIVDTDNNQVVYYGDIQSSLPPDSSTGDRISVIDFSNLNRTGDFVIRMKDSGGISSEPFSVAYDLYSKPVLTAIQSYYYNRCGTQVDNGNNWKHETCHAEDAVFYSDPSKERDVAGGWHDAGDYGKFSINTALSSGLLLYLYEVNAGFFTDGQLDIPEQSNGIPDLLDEVRWSLEWLLRMQKNNGAVYHKVSQKKWVGEFLPHEDPEVRYIFRMSSNATAGFAAVAALGSQLFESYSPDFSDRLAGAARQAWRYLEDNPSIQPSGGFSNPPDVAGGEYSDSSDKDVRLWAAIELFKLTRDNSYLEYFAEHYKELLVQELPPLSWKEFHSLALGVFLNTTVPGEFENHQEIVLRSFKDAGDKLVEKQRANNYRTLLGPDEYYWGSASVNLAYSYLLIQLYRKTGVMKYHNTAMDQLHYTLGRNPFNQTFLTGIGTKPVKSPYHQFSMKSDYQEPVPGMMVGGPNSHLHLQGREISSYPGKNYQDVEKNYLVNEVAINFTAIFAYVAGYFKSVNQDKNTYEAG